MRPLQVTFLVIQAIALVEAAKVRWTLHKSCYRTKDDSGDDNDLAQAIIDSVESAKKWANRATSKIGDSVDIIPGHGKATKDAIRPLLGSGDYATAAKDVRDRFKKVADLDGPIGKGGDALGRYDGSQAWRDLEISDNHHFNFVSFAKY
ncbi:hypothetical protein DL769_011026 [Monosporascus sp. CRB-8-3]|nr:hypothetical protein DL769_011026 [Monosporascus sp. CRB-8-3]